MEDAKKHIVGCNSSLELDFTLRLGEDLVILRAFFDDDAVFSVYNMREEPLEAIIKLQILSVRGDKWNFQHTFDPSLIRDKTDFEIGSEVLERAGCLSPDRTLKSRICKLV